jgi:glutathione S-transferase
MAILPPSPDINFSHRYQQTTKMATQEPLVRFYELSGPKPWSPSCWSIRYALNYKGIPYSVTKLSYPAIEPTCESLFPSMEGLDATVPIVEILAPPYAAINDSTPIALLLNERFTEKDGFKDLRGLENVAKHEEEQKFLVRSLLRWIMYDVYQNALDPSDGSKEFFKRTREEFLGVELKDVLEVKGGGEEAVLQAIKNNWANLQRRMKDDDGSGEREYLSIG